MSAVTAPHLQVLSNEHADVLDEIDALRGKLDMLQTSVVAGVQTPGGARTMLDNFRTGSSGGGLRSVLDWDLEDRLAGWQWCMDRHVVVVWQHGLVWL